MNLYLMILIFLSWTFDKVELQKLQKDGPNYSYVINPYSVPMSPATNFEIGSQFNEANIKISLYGKLIV
ncbi:MAG: hypothetical protein ABJI69_01755 [Balneola sp.]